MRHGQNPTLDDLVFTKREDIFMDIVLTSALLKSDHATFIAKLSYAIEIAGQLALPITISIIFQKLLNECQIPDDWRKASITPISKKVSRSSPNIYRHVSLTSTICKSMETLIWERIMDHLQRNNLICKQQHGVTTGRSCITQMLETLNCCIEILDQGGSVDT